MGGVVGLLKEADVVISLLPAPMHVSTVVVCE